MTCLRAMVVMFACQAGLVLPAYADQWNSMVLVHCYELGGLQYQQHFFARVFLTEVGGGQFYSESHKANGPRSIRVLNEEPARCLIDKKEISFETVEYRAPTIRGWCGLCEQTGFRITVNGNVIWEAAKPETRGDPIFNGTIDMDRDMLRVCEESAPEALGVEIPFEQDFFTARTRVVVCQTFSY